MKLTLGPIVSDARGRFGGQVFSAWKGIALSRRFQPPANPNTVDQQSVRNIFRNLSKQYTVQGAEFRAAWTTFATGKKFIARNSIIAKNVKLLSLISDCQGYVFAPGDASSLAPTAITVTPGAGQLVVAVTAPTAPAGWTLVSAIAVAIRSVDMKTDQTYGTLTPTEGSDASTPYSITLAALATVLYEVGAFLKWTAPDGSTRYSASINGRDTPT